MDRTQANRSSAARPDPRPLLAVVALAALLAGCAGLSVPGVGGGGVTGPAFTGDPCALITSAEIETTIGNGNVSESPEPNHESATDSGCAWTLDSPGNPVSDNVSLTIKAPGGKADFVSTRQFLAAFQGGLNSLVAPAESAIASFGLPANIGISLQSVPGLGDDAFIGAAGTVYAIKGDTELSLQLIAFDDSKAQQDTIDLLKKAVGRLP